MPCWVTMGDMTDVCVFGVCDAQVFWWRDGEQDTLCTMGVTGCQILLHWVVVVVVVVVDRAPAEKQGISGNIQYTLNADTVYQWWRHCSGSCNLTMSNNQQMKYRKWNNIYELKPNKTHKGETSVPGLQHQLVWVVATAARLLSVQSS